MTHVQSWNTANLINTLLYVHVYCMYCTMMYLQLLDYYTFKVVEDELIREHMVSILEMENSGIVHMLKNTRTNGNTMFYSS